MHIRRWPAAVCILLFIWSAGLATAQTRYNPEISVIGDVRAETADRPADIGLEQKAVYDLHEVELAVQGYLNPYARADVFFAWHGDAAEVEEAYVTFERGLPWGLSVRAGRYLADFGRLNLLHPHAYSFIDRPLVHQAYLGHHGFADDGVSLRWLMPISAVYAVLSADLLRGAVFAGGHHHHDHEENTPPDKGLLSRLSIAGATGDFAETAGGFSLAYGHYDPEENLKSLLMGIDLKHKYKPNRYTSLTIMAETIVNRRQVSEQNHHAHEGMESGAKQDGGEGSEYKNFFGAYAFVDYQFKQRYNVGAKFDYYEPLEDRNNDVKQFQAFAGFAPVEETTLLRLTGYYRKPAEGVGIYGALVQLIFSLGPHRPHYF